MIKADIRAWTITLKRLLPLTLITLVWSLSGVSLWAFYGALLLLGGIPSSDRSGASDTQKGVARRQSPQRVGIALLPRSSRYPMRRPSQTHPPSHNSLAGSPGWFALLWPGVWSCSSPSRLRPSRFSLSPPHSSRSASCSQSRYRSGCFSLNTSALRSRLRDWR